MGNGIAQSFAQHGFQVTLIDVSSAALEKALATISKNLDRLIAKETIRKEAKDPILNNISTSTELSSAVSAVDLVIEAVTENASVKYGLFRQLDTIVQAHCILATNTSSLSITEIAAQTSHPERVIGMHFMNPVPVMKLVEVIKGRHTSPGVVDTILALCKDLMKIPCVVNDAPGFVANRILMPMINEAILCLQEGVGGVQEIDTIMKLGMAHPMGPLQLADFIGLDVCLSIMEVLHAGFKTPKYEPCTLLVEMVKEGKLGVKSGDGFYCYTPGSKELVVNPRFQVH
jgi:3-hydroxybutyryl-CoA dehydrogenase